MNLQALGILTGRAMGWATRAAGRKLASKPTVWIAGIGSGVAIGASAGYGFVKSSGVLEPFRYPKQGMGLVGAGPGYNTTFKKPGGAMPANNLGATGDLTLALHTNRHGFGR